MDYLVFFLLYSFVSIPLMIKTTGEYYKKIVLTPISIGEGNGNPLQCSCLENPRDGGAWWAYGYGVTDRVGHD